MIKQEKIELYKNHMQRVKKEKGFKPNTVFVFNTILDYFKDRPLPNKSVCFLDEFVEVTGLTKTTVKKHISILEDAGIIHLYQNRYDWLVMELTLSSGYEYVEEATFERLFMGQIELPFSGYNAEHRLVMVNTGHPAIYCQDTGIHLWGSFGDDVYD